MSVQDKLVITEDRIDATRHVVAVRGELDIFTAPTLKEILADAIDAGQIRIVVDLTETTFLDSNGLGLLIGATTRLRSRGGSLAIVSVNDNITTTFRMTRLDQIFKILPTRERAITAVSRANAA